MKESGIYPEYLDSYLKEYVLPVLPAIEQQKSLLKKQESIALPPRTTQNERTVWLFPWISEKSTLTDNVQTIAATVYSTLS